MGSTSPTDPHNLDASEKARQALAARRDGKQWAEIAGELGYADASGAYRAAKRLLDRTEFEAVEEYRAIEADRLDEAHRIQFGALEVLVSMGKFEAIPPAVSALAKISDRRSKLLGLDAPTRVDVAHSGEDFAATAAKLMKEIGLAVPSDFTPDEDSAEAEDQDEEAHGGGDPWVR
ncbi:hypothetical protein G352_23996 [Rhodococcus ruber BKS 20-38]|uniref:Terminase small subunit n=1 Tax=Rhodococcus ruber BKS 20-38 TaxID=1278076 RepID=M2YGD4_9NOCA|nr:hypothetical protein [Rhodococcus ruber]EME53757.1 hypothetical protein G352_23996 [Rhodococcus ruber BKS 20-38]